MSEPTDLSKPLKTWSHLAGQRRRPSEYEIVSTNLLWSTDGDMPWAMSPGTHMNKWYLKYRNGSPLKHTDWDAFRDPDEQIYRSYNIQQDGQETYVDGLLDDHNRNNHDQSLSAEWIATLARLYAPSRYALHSVQMGSAYLVQMVPASTIENCAMLQAADQLRWVSRVAYRTKELQLAYPDAGFGTGERACWETDTAWQGFRELLEKTLIAYDWAEHFVALNLVAKPAVDEAIVNQLGDVAARENNDVLLALMSDAQAIDNERSRNWSRALVEFATGEDGNREVLEGWLAKWVPLGDQAIDAYCAALPAGAQAADAARAAAKAWRVDLGFSI